MLIFLYFCSSEQNKGLAILLATLHNVICVIAHLRHFDRKIALQVTVNLSKKSSFFAIVEIFSRG